MTIELTKQFRFDAAHTLKREIEAESSRRIHGHSYRAEVTLRGEPDPATGMLLDFGYFAAALEGVRQALDHHLLDEVPDLGPATMENLAMWIWRRLEPGLPRLFRVTVLRDSLGDAAAYFGPKRS